METETELISTVVKALLSSISMSHPIYCPELKTEDDCARLQGTLPLVYIWNEDSSTGSCEISINGQIVGDTLEGYLPRSYPNFVFLRDTIMNTIKDLAIPSIMKVCGVTGSLPSVAFSEEAYRALINEENDG